MKKILLVLILLTLIPLSFALIQNPNLPKITSTQSNIISSIGGSGNVSSVTSSTNCITVANPTSAVVLTFNTSCSGTGNSSWNEAYANTLYRKLGDTINQNNISNFFNNLVTSGIGNSTYQPIGISFNQTEFNFIQNLTAYACGTGLVVDGVNTNGTVICVADANTGGVISNSSLNLQYLNLSGTNANQNINIGLFNLTTTGFFKGLFNWVIGANPSGRYLTFNGSTLDFNESNLNQTIDKRIVLNNTNIRNIFNQDLNTTNNVEFNNITSKNISSSQWILGKDILLNNAGGGIISPLTTFQVTTQDIVSGLLSIPVISMTGANTAIGGGGIRNILFVIAQSSSITPRVILSNTNADDAWEIARNNESGYLDIYRIDPIGGTKSMSIINATGQNITSNHQTYNISMALDTTYTNTYQRPISLKVTFLSTVQSTNDIAYATLYSNGTRHYQQEGVLLYGGADLADANQEYHALEIDVQPNEKYSLNSTVSGVGSITLTRAEVIVI